MDKTTVKIAIVLCVAIPLVNAGALLTGFATGNPLAVAWPGFLVVLLYMVGKESTLRDLVMIIVSGIIGIGFSWLGNWAIGQFMAFLPSLAAISLAVCLGVFIYALLMGPLPWLFNNYGFLYYLVGACFSPLLPVQWGVSFVVIAPVFAVLVMGGIRLLCGFSPIKLTWAKPEASPAGGEPTPAS
jgi:hypothetical protein